jgi:preprotein translocase subunit SecG
MKLLVSIFIVIAMSFSNVASAENDSSFKKQKKTFQNISTKKFFFYMENKKTEKIFLLIKTVMG